MSAIDLLKRHVAWGKAVDRNHLFSYENIGEMIDEAEQRAAGEHQQQGGVSK